MSLPVIAIFDIGKTNKKLLLFDAAYQVVYQESEQFAETADADGFPCEDLQLLTGWINDRFEWLLAQPRYQVRALNCSAYGASLVHLGGDGLPVTPLFNYLKPYPASLRQQFYDTYGGELALATTTASPVLGHLNSGMQLYWLKHQHPQLFQRIACSLHLPQYISYLLAGARASDITSVGCHTHLWDFSMGRYHHWLEAEGLLSKLAPLHPATDVVSYQLPGGNTLPVGIGLHDSSAALIPYLLQFKEPFVLLSTGTWCIALNPFNKQPLSSEELQQDCLCYLSYQGVPVKASRLFAGHEHEVESMRIARFFGVADTFFQTVSFDPSFSPAAGTGSGTGTTGPHQHSGFACRDLAHFADAASAYHQLVCDLVQLQVQALALVLNGGPVQHLYVDGGFSKNEVYMHLLAAAFPQLEVYAASMAQASALGAALLLHPHWNPHPLQDSLVSLQRYRPNTSAVLT